MDELNTVIPQTGEQTTETQTTENTTQQAGEQTEQMFKLKYNHEEREIPYSQAVELAQKGMNYDKAIERARQEAATEAAQKARDSWIAEQGYEWNGKPIKTEAEYKNALKEKELMDKIKSQYSNVPEEIVNELLESRKFREETQAEKKARQEQEAKQKDYTDFIAWHTKAYGKEPDPGTIPAEVWQSVKQGVPLKAAFMEYAINGYLTKEQQAKLAEQTQQANEKNANTSTGSVKGSGTHTFFTREQVEAMTQDQAYKHYDAIEESRKHWK